MRERIITAICLLVVVLPLVFLGGYWFLALMLVAASMAIFEMVNMYEAKAGSSTIFKILLILMSLAIIFVPTLQQAIGIFGVFSLSVGVAMLFSKIEPAMGNFYMKTFIYIGFSFRALIEIRNDSLSLFIFLIATVVLTDSMAYFSGRFFGKRKLAPKISPNKTVEGAIGGWVTGALFALVFGLHQALFSHIWVLIVLALALPILSQLGDLLASALKRKYGIKDYGNLFPGHGGVMDRVDSQLLAAMLIYMMVLIGGLS